MTDVHASATGASAGIEEESLATLMKIKNLIKIPMAEEETASQPACYFVLATVVHKFVYESSTVRFVSSDLGESFKKLVVD